MQQVAAGGAPSLADRLPDKAEDKSRGSLVSEPQLE